MYIRQSDDKDCSKRHRIHEMLVMIVPFVWSQRQGSKDLYPGLL